MVTVKTKIHSNRHCIQSFLTGCDFRWTKEFRLKLPGFENSEACRSVAIAFKGAVYDCFLRSVESLPGRPCVESELMWVIALGLIKYGAIYFLSRAEAKHASCVLQGKENQIDELVDWLKEDHRSVRIINSAMADFVCNGGFSTFPAAFKLPPFALSIAGPNKVYANAETLQATPDAMRNCRRAKYDLHDLAHFCCVNICDSLYAAPYYNDFAELPRRLTSLIFDAQFKNDRARDHSDNLLFRELSLGLFDGVSDAIDDQQVVDIIGMKLAQYSDCKVELLQPSTGKLRKPATSLAHDELAVLSQNKSYEHPASEFEELLFVRGGDPAKLDPLSGEPGSVVLNRIANSSFFYFERRNFLRHRAHRLAYVRYCELALAREQDSKERDFLKTVHENLTFQDFRNGNRVELMTLVRRRVAV